jgi:tetratricopeptide (TPR) repeat protein
LPPKSAILKKQQIALISSGVLLFVLMYFFGRTIPTPKPSEAKKQEAASGSTTHDHKAFDIQSVLTTTKAQLTPDQQAKVTQMENAVVRGNVKDQQIKVYRQLANFYKDTVHALLPYAYYTSEAAKLENSEKSLTFAAHFLLDGVRSQQDHVLKEWLASNAKELFEKALAINPNNDSSKVGLGSCYLFGEISETPMQGISMIREVAEKDPNNMYAQMMLGIGGMVSGQYDRAIERLSKVVEAQPGNPEAVVMLAEAYERKGDKQNAIKWYTASKKVITNKEITEEIDRRIAELSK